MALLSVFVSFSSLLVLLCYGSTILPKSQCPAANIPAIFNCPGSNFNLVPFNVSLGFTAGNVTAVPPVLPSDPFYTKTICINLKSLCNVGIGTNTTPSALAWVSLVAPVINECDHPLSLCDSGCQALTIAAGTPGTPPLAIAPSSFAQIIPVCCPFPATITTTAGPVKTTINRCGTINATALATQPCADNSGTCSMLLPV